MKVAFLDRDGTLLWEPPDNKWIDSADSVHVLPGVIDMLHTLQKKGFALVIVSNQGSSGTETTRKRAFEVTQKKFESLLEKEGIEFAAVFCCPHVHGNGCNCQKPLTGLVDAFIEENNVNLDQSCMIGDRETDAEFADNLGIEFIGAETNRGFVEEES